MNLPSPSCCKRFFLVEAMRASSPEMCLPCSSSHFSLLRSTSSSSFFCSSLTETGRESPESRLVDAGREAGWGTWLADLLDGTLSFLYLHILGLRPPCMALLLIKGGWVPLHSAFWVGPTFINQDFFKGGNQCTFCKVDPKAMTLILKDVIFSPLLPLPVLSTPTPLLLCFQVPYQPHTQMM